MTKEKQYNLTAKIKNGNNIYVYKKHRAKYYVISKRIKAAPVKKRYINRISGEINAENQQTVEMIRKN